LYFKLVARCEFNIFIAAEIQWRLCSPNALTDKIDIGITPPYPSHSRLVGKFNIEMTLTTRRVGVGAVDMGKVRINECQLTEKAFLPNQYTVRVEQGKFMAVNDVPFVRELPCISTYSYRLIFDPSPFPPQHMWKDPAGAPESIRFWEWTQFQAYPRPIKWQMTWGGKMLNTFLRTIGWD
jgi:hypothetical protein